MIPEEYLQFLWSIVLARQVTEVRAYEEYVLKNEVMALGLHCGVSSQSVSEEVSHADRCSCRNSRLVIVHIASVGSIPSAPTRILRHRNIVHKGSITLVTANIKVQTSCQRKLNRDFS